MNDEQIQNLLTLTARAVAAETWKSIITGEEAHRESERAEPLEPKLAVYGEDNEGCADGTEVTVGYFDGNGLYSISYRLAPGSTDYQRDPIEEWDYEAFHPYQQGDDPEVKPLEPIGWTKIEWPRWPQKESDVLTVLDASLVAARQRARESWPYSGTSDEVRHIEMSYGERGLKLPEDR